MKVVFDFSVYSFLGCNIKKELKNIKTAIYQEFTVASKEQIYDPLKLKLFCISSGAPRLFDAILDAMTDPSHSSVRIELNKKRTVVMLYQLCYGLSQNCNWYQCDNAVFLKDCHLNQQGLSAERLVGSTCNRQNTNEILHHLSSGNARSINELISAVGNFARYLALLCSRDLGTTIAGANITVLAALLIIINGHYEIKKLVIVIFSRTKEKRT
ncbi:uncharacterized protein LOC114949318 [Acropora millepora]|uniref:uncharacterized protein LOC114949318 n=1 Tax=Acropora millepora TaxID=45264 RepID=UPI001CF2D446|nr:uncharacterized protein LOC114949318 [Acropora millepora]